MYWLLLGLLGGFAFVYLTRLFWADTASGEASDAQRSPTAAFDSPRVKAAIVALTLTLLMLVIAGKVHWLSAALTGAVPFARRAATLVRITPFLRQLKDRLDNTATQQSRRRGTPNAGVGELTEAQARLMLDVSVNATAAEITAAHRRLIARNHPDRGGSTYIAAQLNAAKDLLLSTSMS